MPTVAVVSKKPPQYVRLCWPCRDTGTPTPVGEPVASPEAAARQPGKCPTCYQRSLHGLPLGRRVDA